MGMELWEVYRVHRYIRRLFDRLLHPARIETFHHSTTMSAAGSAFFFAIYYIPLYFQFVHGDSAIKAAVRLV